MNKDSNTKSKRIWIVNPFEEFPVEGTTPLRYGTLSRVLVERRHEVVWWSSDFSHLTKKNRPQPKDEEHLHFRLVPVPPYRRHVGLARWRSHRKFERGFLQQARNAVAKGELNQPDLILVGLPPLGAARAAFHLRELWGCKVVVDIVDAWPETFLRLLPGKQRTRSFLGRVLFHRLFREARRAYRGANAITSVAQMFLDLPRKAGSTVPVHVTYLGGEGRKKEEGRRRKEPGSHCSESSSKIRSTSECSEFSPKIRSATKGSESSSKNRSVSMVDEGVASSLQERERLRFVYIGAMGQSYDLETVVRAAAVLERRGAQFELHFAGAGPKEGWLRQFVKDNRLEECVVFHGYLDANRLWSLLSASDVALVPIFQDSWIAFPYKLSEYLCAGLPVISSLSGEVEELLTSYDAGCSYPEGDVEALAERMSGYCNNSEQVEAQARNARKLAEDYLDRTKTYPALAVFLEEVAGR